MFTMYSADGVIDRYVRKVPDTHNYLISGQDSAKDSLQVL